MLYEKRPYCRGTAIGSFLCGVVVIFGEWGNKKRELLVSSSLKVVVLGL